MTGTASTALMNSEFQSSTNLKFSQQLNSAMFSGIGMSSVLVDADGELYFDEDFQVPFDAHLMPLTAGEL